MNMRFFAAALCALAVTVAAGAASAQDLNKSTHLGNTGNTAVNNVKAREYMQRQGGGGDAYEDMSDTVVHVGSAKKGDCNMNVGGTPSGAGPNKETVVTAKNIINICK